MLRRETGQTISEWIFQDLLCRWRSLVEIVSDNGTPVVKALEYLAAKYNIYHTRISGYNSRANGIAERPHYDVRETLVKSMEGDSSKRSQHADTVF